MNSILKFLVIFLIFHLTPGDSFADEKTAIALFDEAVDLEHPELVPFLDHALMNQLKVDNIFEQTESWSTMSEEITHFLNSPQFQEEYRDQVEFRNTIGKLRSGKLKLVEKIKLIGGLSKGGLRYASSSKWRSKFQETLEHLHGTHMAGMAIKGLNPDRVKLLSFPYLRTNWPGPELSWEHALDHLIVVNPEKMRKHLEKVSEGLREAKVRVVNISFGSTVGHAFRELTELKKRYGGKVIRQEAEKLASANRGEIERFVLSNPNIVFVLAAGNQHTNLEKYGETNRDWSTIKAPNAVAVGGMNGKGKPSILSDYGPKFIDVLAPTSGVEGPQAGGGKIFFSGNSVSAAIVTNRFGKIFSDNPGLTAIQAVEQLKGSEIDDRSRLKDCGLSKIQ